MNSKIAVPARCLLAAAVTLTSFSILAGPTAAAAVTVAPGPARQADSLVEAFGVNVHMAYGTTPYKDATKIAAALKALGTRHVRDRLRLNRTDQFAALRTLRTSGIKSDLIMGDPLNQSGTPAQLVTAVATQLPDVADSLEGANEWNLTGRTNWAAELRAHQTEVFKRANANPATAKLPVLGPALGRRVGFSTLGDLSSVLDLGNNHQYPGGLQPSVHIDDMIAAERLVAGAKPQMMTESGYNTAVGSTVGNLPVTEKVGGYYAPKLLLEHFNRGVVRMYDYELVDQKLDPTFVNPEANFGLLRNDMTPKPAYTAVKNLLQLVSDPGPAFQPGGLSYTLGGSTTGVRKVLLQKRDGRFYLILWRDISLYTPKTKTVTTNPAVNVTVNLAQPTAMSVYRPSVQTKALSGSTTATTINVPLSDDAVAVEISPNQLPVAPLAPTGVTATPGDAAATVGWAAPASSGSSPVSSYKITASPGGKSTTVGSTARTAVVTGLTNYVGYGFSVQAVSQAGTSRASASSTVVTPKPPAVAIAREAQVWGGWHAAGSTAPGGSGYRISQTPGDIATFAFHGTSVGWTSLAGPTMGRAQLAVDGIGHGQVDLYRRTSGVVTTSLTKLTDADHVLVVRVLGTRTPVSRGTSVSVDAFKGGSTIAQETDPKVAFSTWRPATTPVAFTSSAFAGATMQAAFNGTAIELLTAKGPGYGKAQISVDGTSRGTIDLYSATATWDAVVSFTGLAAGTHTVTLTVLGSRSAGSTANKVAVRGLQAR